MKLKNKKEIRMVLLVAVVLALGLAIQLALVPLVSARRQAKAEEETSAQATPEPTLEPPPEPTPKPSPPPEPKGPTIEEGDILLLVNRWNPVPEGYAPDLVDMGNEQSLDRRCAASLRKMLKDCEKAGGRPLLCSSYRTQAYQQRLFDNKISRLIEEGVDPEEAPAEAAQVVAVPGTSEHQLGLAADIIDRGYAILDEGQEDTATQQWLMENSWRYGFILRYPNGTTEITGIIYEPWHYRYVGLHAAEEIYERGVTLEEYIDLLVY